MPFTNKEKAQEARRECSYREWVYSKKVTEGSMKQEDAVRRLAIMREITLDYDALAEADAPKFL